MKVFFDEKDRNQVLKRIQEAMEGRKLADLVNFSLAPGHLEVKISKLGTSVLDFTEKELKDGLEYALKSEKIAFAHRAFKNEVTEKIIKVIETAGGKVTT